MHLTVPIRWQFGQPISDVRIDTGQPWSRRRWRTCSQAYRQATYRHVRASRVAELCERRWSKLIDLDVALTELLVDGWGCASSSCALAR